MQEAFSGPVSRETLGSFPLDLNAGSPPADPWSVRRRAELGHWDGWVLILAFETLGPSVPENNPLNYFCTKTNKFTVFLVGKLAFVPSSCIYKRPYPIPMNVHSPRAVP